MSLRRQVQRTFKSLREARAWRDETRAQVARGPFTAPTRITVRALASAWLASRRDIRAKSVEGYEQALSTALVRIGDRPAQSITRPDVEALVTWLATEGGHRGKGLGARSITYTLGALRQVFEFGVSSGVLAANPAAKVKPPRRSEDAQTPPRVWTPEELLAFRDHADGDPWAGALRVSLCGLRRSEVLGLRWSEVDLDGGTVEVRRGRVALRHGRTIEDDTKRRTSRRTVPVEQMHPGTMALLRALSARQAEERLAAGQAYGGSDLVVVGALGQGVKPDAYGARFRTLCVDAGVASVRLHAIRHTLATILHDRGVPPAAAAALLGHSLGVHLSVYVRPSQTGAASAAAVFVEVMAAAGVCGDRLRGRSWCDLCASCVPPGVSGRVRCV